MKIEKINRKSFEIKFSGRSTDFISPSIIYECGFKCTYCYVKRHNQKTITVSKNIGSILTVINNHAMFTIIKKPNQTHESLITYDIGCNSDIALHAKHHDWEYVFDFFKNHPVAMGSFATKYVNKNLLQFNPKGKIRIRFSLMPQIYSDFLEPKTSSIENRLEAVKDFIIAGYEVHLNFSPVIVTENWLKEYKKLFEKVNEFAIKDGWNDGSVKAEVIFLTHNIDRHIHNLNNNNSKSEELIWRPDIQESKISQYGGKNLRYKYNLKAIYIKKFIELHNLIIPYNTIRYIF
jgi:spore photoproduct lyase